MPDVTTPPLGFLQKPLEGSVDALLGLFGLDNPGAQQTNANGIAQMLAAALPMVAATVAKVAPEAIQGIKAYHGSPHDFDQFLASKIGTGEGAQAYGHGLYFAEKEGTAQVYRDKLGGDAIKFPDGTQKVYQHDASPEWIAQNHLNTFAGATDIDPYQAARQQIRQEIDRGLGKNNGRYAANIKALDVLREWEAAGATPGPAGRMYEVNIKADPSQFLDWDKPIGQLSPEVRARLEDALPWMKRADQERLNRAPLRAVLSEADTGSPAATSEALKQAGIPGIKYLDGGSRAAGNGTSNYVVFDDALISILRKYGLLPPLAAGMASMANHLPAPQAKQ
jgi:hypothetical protein